MTEPRSFAVELPGRDVTLAVYDWGGEGPVALCAHANGFCGRLWEGVASALAGRFRVLAYDARGHGASSVPPAPQSYSWEALGDDLVALSTRLCERLGIERITCGVGNSMGGAAMLIAASRAPSRFACLALFDPVVIPRSPDAPPRPNNEMGEIARRRRQVFPSRTEVIAQYRERALFADWLPRSLELYAEHGFRDRPDGQVELRCAGEVEGAIFSRATELDLAAIVRGLEVPGELMRASEGQFGLEPYQELAAVAPGLEVSMYEGGHLAPMSDPALVARRIEAVCARAGAS